MTNEEGISIAILIPLVIILIIAVLALFSMTIVSAGNKGVKLKFGAVQKGILSEGLYFNIPFVESIVTMEVRTLKYQVEADSASKDLQSVTTTIALNYHIDSEKIDILFQKIGTDYQDRIIAPAIEESVKASTARFTAEELITKRRK